IVAIHGFRGHAMNTWTYSDPASSSAPYMWIRDLIPIRLPGARVMSFGYDASLLSGSTGSVWEVAKQLLNSLRNYRNTPTLQRRPIIFIAHSLGGLVVKAALALSRSQGGIYGSTHDETCAIAFFGTPHRGSKKASWARIIASIGSIYKHVSVGTLAGVLKKDCASLLDLEESFLPVLRDGRIQILSFFELQPTKFRWFRGGIVVPKDSAILGQPGELRIPVNACHRSMCRFSSADE
ncbi:Alpha/Beta hydrolase protein, partial [Cercophora newfieldiana]